MEPLVGALIALVSTTAIVFVVGIVATRRYADAGSRLRKLTSTQREKPTPPRASAAREDMLPTVTRMLLGKSVTERLYTGLASAGVPIRPSEFVGILVASVIVCEAIAFLVGRGWPLYVFFAAVGMAVPIAVLRALQQKRRAMFEAQIVDALTLIASSIRSGFSFLRALQMAAQEMPEPISTELKRVVSEVNVGRSMEDALRGVVSRVRSYDFDLVVTAVLIQLQAGGNLADILDTIAETIRERVRIMGEIRTLTAEGRISGIALILLPIGLAIVLTVMRPSYMESLYTQTVGHYLIGIAAVLQIVGALIIRKMLIIDF